MVGAALAFPAQVGVLRCPAFLAENDISEDRERLDRFLGAIAKAIVARSGARNATGACSAPFCAMR